MKTLPLHSNEQDFSEAVKSWLRKAAEHGYTSASKDFHNHDIDSCWSEEMVTQITQNHFDDGQACTITTPDPHTELYEDVFKYDDDSGYSVDHGIALNSKASDFTLQVEFIKFHDGYRMFFRDIHVL